MNKVTNKEKDEALQAFYLHEGRRVSDDIMAMLYSDGYIEKLTSVNGSVIRITNKGKAFLFRRRLRWKGKKGKEK